MLEIILVFSLSIIDVSYEVFKKGWDTDSDTIDSEKAIIKTLNWNLCQFYIA